MADAIRIYNIATCTVAVLLSVIVLVQYAARLVSGIRRFDTEWSLAKSTHIVLVATSHVGLLATGGAWSSVQGNGFTMWTVPLAFFATQSSVALGFMCFHLYYERREIERQPG